MTLRVGFLGAGLIAGFHSKLIRRSGIDVSRAGVYDPDVLRAQSFAAASGHRVCASEEEVLDSCDVVYICSWTSEHPRLLAKALDRKLAVFCEKPLATSLADAASMAEAVRASGVTNQVGLVLRRSPAYLWAHRLISDSVSGPVMAVVFRDDQFIPTQGLYASTWRGDVAKAGAGTLLEHSIHDVDMLHYLVGDIATVSVHKANFHGHEGIEDVVTATIEFSGGALGTLTTLWHDNLARPSLRRVEVFCANRYVHIEGDDWTGPVHWTDSDGSSHTLAGDELENAVAALRDGPANPDAAFLRAVIDRTPAWPDFSVALAAHRVVDAAYRSANAGGDRQQVPRS